MTTKTAQIAAACFIAGVSKKVGNTQVLHKNGVTELRLFGKLIARYEN